jgi:peptide methionine sulfoxide reductase msrA/msrB
MRPIHLALLLLICAPALTGQGCAQGTGAEPSATTSTTTAKEGKTSMITARLIGPDGKLTAPVSTARVELSDAQWRERLDEEQYRILRRKGTEAAFCGNLLANKETGFYLCAGCNLPLFESAAKFESGTGWPSFFKPVGPENIREERDSSYGMVRTEILCPRCGGHLGHVFEDGPQPTGLRYCLNSESLTFARANEAAKYAEKPAAEPMGSPAKEMPQPSAPASGRAEAIFAGGCFWCVEAVFEQIDGVQDAISGYAGGSAETANYEAVCGGDTGHAEAVKIVYDPSKVSYEQLLKIHFATHDPTTLNRQGNDTGTQYRSAIFYADEAEKKIAEAFIAHLGTDKTFGGKKIVTMLEPLTTFYPAETYHQNFVCNNPYQGYVRGVAMPKVEKTREKFKDLLKPEALLKP